MASSDLSILKFSRNCPPRRFRSSYCFRRFLRAKTIHWEISAIKRKVSISNTIITWKVLIYTFSNEIFFKVLHTFLYILNFWCSLRSNENCWQFSENFIGWTNSRKSFVRNPTSSLPLFDCNKILQYDIKLRKKMRHLLYLLYLYSAIFRQYLLPYEVYRNAKVFVVPKNLLENWKRVALQDHHMLREFAATLICRYFLSLWLPHSPTIMHDIR